MSRALHAILITFLIQVLKAKLLSSVGYWQVCALNNRFFFIGTLTRANWTNREGMKIGGIAHRTLRR